MPYEKGSARWNAVLDEDKVQLARRLYKEGYSHHFIGEMIGVSPSTVVSAVTGKTWSHVPGAIASKRKDLRNRGGSLAVGAKLDEDDVRKIKTLLSRGTNIADVATEFHVGHSAIRDIIRGHTWKNVMPGIKLKPGKKVARGEKIWSARLTEEKVAIIKACCISGVSVLSIVSHFGISISQVKRIRSGQSWAHVKPSKFTQKSLFGRLPTDTTKPRLRDSRAESERAKAVDRLKKRLRVLPV